MIKHIILLIAVIFLFGCSNIEVNNFTECVEAGNPVMESYPRQCRHGEELFVENITINVSPDDSKNLKIYCEPTLGEGYACTAEYDPVCGWSNPEKIQCIKYPCASTFSNGCHACLNENVLYYTAGQCPTG